MKTECDCKSMAVTDESQMLHGHHENCATNTEKHEMVSVRFDGVAAIMEFDDAVDCLRDSDGEEYEIKKVWMTQNELDALPEFMGW